MRTVSPWIDDCTFFSLWSLRKRTISRHWSLENPLTSSIAWRIVIPAAGSALPGLRFWIGTLRLTILDWSTSHTAWSLNSSGAVSVIDLALASSSMPTVTPLKS